MTPPSPPPRPTASGARLAERARREWRRLASRDRGGDDAEPSRQVLETLAGAVVSGALRRTPGGILRAVEALAPGMTAARQLLMLTALRRAVESDGDAALADWPLLIDQAVLRLSGEGRGGSERVVAELKIAKDDLQQHLTRFYQIVRELPIALVGCDRDWSVRLWNRAASLLCGWTQADLMRRPLDGLLSESDRERLALAETTAQGGVARLPVTLHARSGETIPAMAAISRLTPEERGRIVRLISLSDRREERGDSARVRKIDQLSAIARLSGAIMHDIRNPLNTIALTADVIAQLLDGAAGVDGRVSELLDCIQTQITRLSDVLNQYLGYSRLATMERGRLDLDAALAELVAELRLEPRGAGVTIRYRRPRRPLAIHGDWTLLRRALTNLLVNALEVLAGSGEIEVRLSRRHRRAVLRIADSGPGLSDTVRARLFDPYVTTKSSGTGLGLYVAREIVTAHEGRIRYVGSPERGAVFTITLPLADD